MLGRRLLILVAVLMGLTALAASVAPRDQRVAPGVAPAPSAQEASPAPSAQADAQDGGGRTLEKTVSASGGRPARLVIDVGDTLVLTVAGGQPDEVAVEAFGALEPVDADSPAVLDLYADTPGTYPVRMVEAGRDIGTIEVRG